jgi:hypothetical protein
LAVISTYALNNTFVENGTYSADGSIIPNDYSFNISVTPQYYTVYSNIPPDSAQAQDNVQPTPVNGYEFIITEAKGNIANANDVQLSLMLSTDAVAGPRAYITLTASGNQLTGTLTEAVIQDDALFPPLNGAITWTATITFNVPGTFNVGVNLIPIS